MRDLTLPQPGDLLVPELVAGEKDELVLSRETSTSDPFFLGAAHVSVTAPDPPCGAVKLLAILVAIFNPCCTASLRPSERDQIDRIDNLTKKVQKGIQSRCSYL
jgi:hypothetical protein